MPLTTLARAKVNLFLHVGPLQADGYHPLASLVAFADVGDVITVAPADGLSLALTGPFAVELTGDGDNLILKALRALGRVAGIGEPKLAVTLDKRLPIAAGLGGGSSDAAAALRLARTVLGLNTDDAALEAVAGEIGADGAMCVRAVTAMAEGRGDRLTEMTQVPPLHAVLFNPGVPSPTGPVYRAYDAGPPADAERPGPPGRWDAAAVIDWLARQRNDLQGPAIALEPVIGEAVHAMAATADVRMARMSGSGATVFGLFDDAASARAAAATLGAQYDRAWVKSCILGDKAALSSE